MSAVSFGLYTAALFCAWDWLDANNLSMAAVFLLLGRLFVDIAEARSK